MLETLNKIFTEEQVNEVSDKILKLTIDKIKYELSNNYYEQMNSYLYEHYENASGYIRGNLIKEITEEFIEDPKNYKYSGLRKAIFNENKESLTSILTDELIEKSIERILMLNIDKNYVYNWRWKDAIITFVRDNWHIFKEDERVNSGLLNQIEQLKSRINDLQEKLENLEV